MRIRFLTSTPLDINRGSGTYVGIEVLAGGLRDIGHEVEIESPRFHLPVYTLERLAFNRGLKRGHGFDLTVGFDMDGYRIAGGDCSHVAALKGVIADEVRFERGLTRLTMAVQAERERLHAQRANRVIVSSMYSAARACEFYSLREQPGVVPEPIALAAWRTLLAANPVPPSRFTVLFVGRFYRRKRIDTLLRASAIARHRVPGLEVRIVGDGPHARPLRRLCHSLGLDNTVVWLGSIPKSQLAAEYNRASVFCLPSEQEAFGIVLLEAMAAGTPVIASGAASIPEVASHGVLFEPGNHEELAGLLEELYRSPERRGAIRAAGLETVKRFDAPIVARLFLAAACSDAGAAMTV